VESRCRGSGVKPAVTTHRVLGRKHLDLDSALSEGFDCLRVRDHAPVGAGTDDQTLGQIGENFIQVLEHQAVAIPAPPIPDNPSREDDDIVSVLLAVDL
jgi:hypothetical protein